MGKTNIEVSHPVWSELHGMKRPGESFDDVLRRELNIDQTEEAAHTAHD